MRVTWTPWLHFNISRWDYATRSKVLATLLQMFVKMSSEPKVREHLQLLTILHEAISYPWDLLDYPSIESIFEWYVSSTEPSAILCLKSEHYAVDNAILRSVKHYFHSNGHPNVNVMRFQFTSIGISNGCSRCNTSTSIFYSFIKTSFIREKHKSIASIEHHETPTASVNAGRTEIFQCSCEEPHESHE